MTHPEYNIRDFTDTIRKKEGQNAEEAKVFLWYRFFMFCRAFERGILLQL